MDKLDSRQAHNLMDRCQKDPLFFSCHVLGAEQPWSKQRDIMYSVRDNPRTAVPSGFSTGKTWCAARVVLWFLFSFPHSLVITTAPTWRQVENVLWAEIRRQHQQSLIPLGGDVLRTQLRIDNDWFGMGLSTDDPDRFQGFHSANLLLVFDEAAGVERPIWDAAEGQMAGSFARWLAIGNPVAPSGPFYDACRSSMWNTIPISCLESPNVEAGKVIYPKLVTKNWVEERMTEWGLESPMYQAKVLGEFPTASEHGLIPLSWVWDSHERATEAVIGSEQRRIGVDVARSGADCTVFLLREGNVVSDVQEHRNLNTMAVAGRLTLFVEDHKVPWEDVIVDVIGIGAGVVDRLHEQKRHVKGVNFGCSPANPEKFRNVRSECYWAVRDALNPQAEKPLAIPAKYSKLASELVAIEWSVTSNGKVQIEPKENVKKRLGHSPDHADALALTYAPTYCEPMLLEVGYYDFDSDSFISYPQARRWI